MKNLEQPSMENFDNKKGVNDEQIFVNANQIFDAKSNRATEDVGEKINSSEGSQNYGKFKDAESLLKAYNSLQAEFTKKSQKLSELENEIEPALRQNKLNAVVEEMANTYSLTEPFKQKLRDTLVGADDSNYEKLAEQNLIKLLAENYKSPEKLINDKEFLSNYVLNNNEIKDAIIKEYLLKLKSVPDIKVATNFNSSIPATPPTSIKTISQAGEIARAIIKKK